MAKIVMTHQFKSPCLICNCVPKDETSEVNHALEMFHAEGVDVNWGEDCNICQICAGVMADMMGRRTQKEYILLAEKHARLIEDHEELVETHAHQKDRLSKILEGRKAQREQRSAA